MNDVFISYSRRDKVFTQKLVEALKAQGRELWADWEDIPPGSDWFAEIKQGIEESQSVLFVLSPEWIKSNECRKELDYAVQMGKRLVPVIWQNIDPKDAPPELAKINWIFMREGDDFDKGFQLVSTTLDTDLDWLKSHTRLQTRALEWDKKNKDNSFVLRGKDLEDAEAFLSHGSHKDPEPTGLQGEYILISRKEAVRVQRMILTGVIAALVVSVVLAIVAAFSWNAARVAKGIAVAERDRAVIAEQTAVAAEAEAVSAKETAVAERDRADLNATIGFSRELASQAISSLDVDPERSLLLALQSIQITNDAKQPVLPASEEALRRAVQTSRIRLSIPGNGAMILGIAFSPDGRLIASANADNSVKVWDISQQASGVISGEPLLDLTSLGSPATSVAFSPDGTQVAASSMDNIAIVWDVASGQELFTLNEHAGRINKILFTPDGGRIVTGSDDGMVKVWDAVTGDLILDLTYLNEPISDLAISPDNQIFATSNYGDVIVWNATTGALVSATPPQGCSSAVAIAINPNMNQLAIANRCIAAEVQDLGTGEWLFDVTDHTDIVNSVSFSPDGNLLASGSFDDTVIVIETTKYKRLFALNDSSDVLAMTFSPDGALIATGNGEGEIKLWDANPINSYENLGFRPHSLRIDGLEFGPDDSHYVSSSWDGTALIWPLAGGTPVALVGHQSQIRDVAISPDGRKIITGAYDGTAMIWDASTGEPLQVLSGDSQNVMAVTFSPDGKLAVGGLDNNTVIVWNTDDWQEVVRLTSDSQFFINEVAFSPDGATLAVANDNTSVILWDTATWQEINSLLGHRDWVKGVAFSPDGKHLVSGSYDKTAIVWDTTTWEPVFTLSGHSQGINDVAYSLDGTLIATASVDGSAKIWDANTGNLITTLLAASNPVLSVAFSRDGSFLATGSETGVIRFYYTRLSDVLTLATTRITRSLTTQECRVYLHQMACPDNLIQPGSSTAPQITLIPPPTNSSGVVLRSGEGTVAVTVSIVNDSNEYLTLYWVDWDGIEQYYGDLAPNSAFEQPTYSTHAWRIRDAAGNVIAEYAATEQATQKITINADKTVKLP